MIREQVIEEAKTWLGTPWHMNACIKGVGVDCGRFPYAVLKFCGVPVPELPEHWPTDWFRHNLALNEPYLKIVQGAYKEVTLPEAGDLVLFKMGKAFSHIAIVASWPLVIYMRGNGSSPRIEIGNAFEWPLAGSSYRFFSPYA
jgi:cell wall-associated NlpC family hydrolase